MADKKSKKYTLTSAKSGVPSRPSGVNTSAQNFFNVVAGSPTFKPQTIKYGGKTYTSTPKYQEAGVGGLKTIAISAGRAIASNPGVKAILADKALGIPVRRSVATMAGNTARGSAKTMAGSAKTVASQVKTAPKPAKYAAGATATGTALYYTGRATSGSKKPGYVPMTAKTTKKPGYVPMTASTAAVSKPRSTAGYVPNAPSSPRKKLTPTSNAPTTERKKPTKPGGNGKATIGGGQVPGRRPGTSVRTYAVQKRLGDAAEAAAAGNFAAAAAYANAALNIQKKGKGSAASMKKVQKVAAAYAKAAKK